MGRLVVGGALLAAAMSPLGIKVGLLWPHGLFFTLHAIFLCGEDKYHKCGGVEFIIVGVGGVEYREADSDGYI